MRTKNGVLRGCFNPSRQPTFYKIQHALQACVLPIVDFHRSLGSPLTQWSRPAE
jgi:hypothetical protein